MKPTHAPGPETGRGLLHDLRGAKALSQFYFFTLGTFAVWRLTHLLQAEDGPWGSAARLRGGLGAYLPDGLFDCFYCLSLWIAAPAAILLGSDNFERLWLWPALSGSAILLHRATESKAEAPPASFQEDEEKTDVMLR